MKSAIRIVSRTLSGDLGPHSSGTRQGRSPVRKGRATRKYSRPTAATPEQDEEARIFCNDMYTVDYVRDSIDVVAGDSTADSIILEDLIERNHPSITKAVHDLFVNTTKSAEMESKPGEEEEESSTERSSSFFTGSNNGSTNSLFGSNNGSTNSLFGGSNGSARSLFGTGNGSSSSLFGGSNQNKKWTSKKEQPQPRVWKSIVFVDCISDSESYEAYLNQKRDFVLELTRFLSMKGFQNDLPIRFEARIEIHTLLHASTMLSLLHRIQRDSTVTRVEFAGALGHTDRHVPEEFEKLLNPESLTVKEMVMIHLHYDKQSLNVDEEEEEGGSAPERKGQQRRESRLNPQMLAVIQRCSWMLERKLKPQNGLGDSLTEFNESATSIDFNSSLLNIAISEEKSDEGQEIILDASFAKALSQSLIDDLLTFDQSIPSISTSKVDESAPSKSKKMAAASMHSDGANAREERPPPIKRVMTDGRLKARSLSPMPSSSSTQTQRPVRRNVSVDDSFWDKGLDKLQKEDVSVDNSRVTRKPCKTTKITPLGSPSKKDRSPPPAVRRTASGSDIRIPTNEPRTKQKNNKLSRSSSEHNVFAKKEKDRSPPPTVRRAASGSDIRSNKEKGSPKPLGRQDNTRAGGKKLSAARRLMMQVDAVEKDSGYKQDTVRRTTSGTPDKRGAKKSASAPDFYNWSLQQKDSEDKFNWDGFLAR